MQRTYDKFFLWTVVSLVVFGFFIFTSAAMGLLAKDGASFSGVLFRQVFFGIIAGGLLLFGASKIDYRLWKKIAIPVFLLSFFLVLLVFVPGAGMEHGGAKRWVSVGSFSFQPSEFLKLGFIIYLSAWLSTRAKEIKSFTFGLVPFLIMIGFVGLVLALEPDIGTLIVIIMAGFFLFFIRGAKYREIGILFLVILAAAILLVLWKPYIFSRVAVFFDPSLDPQGAGWQIKQSLIAIGSGGIFGRGFGMSVQKFKYLPEPVGDSIFSVAAEEFGFIGSFILIVLFLVFFWRGLSISSRAPDSFGRLLAIGIVIIIVGQSFINIASMAGILPLTGLPLIFVSQGASAYLVTMFEVGILLNISKRLKRLR
jgi:cell division protein FtsW